LKRKDFIRTAFFQLRNTTEGCFLKKEALPGRNLLLQCAMGRSFCYEQEAGIKYDDVAYHVVQRGYNRKYVFEKDDGAFVHSPTV